ncbi:MAG: hypothetical protein AAF628_00105 [Planctomycetota bacterium]
MAKWDELVEAGVATTARVSGAPEGSRWQHFYPRDGLVLHAYSRYLPHEGEKRPGRRNTDYVWFTAEEARGFVPADTAVGATRQVDASLIERLARFSFVNNVACLSLHYAAEDVRLAELTARVTSVDADVIDLRFEGRTETAASSSRHRAARWMRVAGTGPFVSERGFSGEVLGTARYDVSAGRFIDFELVSLGETWTRPWRSSEAPAGDRRRTPLGFSLSLGGGGLAETVPPAFVELYGWERPATIRSTARKSVTAAARKSVPAKTRTL